MEEERKTCTPVVFPTLKYKKLSYYFAVMMARQLKKEQNLNGLDIFRLKLKAIFGTERMFTCWFSGVARFTLPTALFASSNLRFTPAILSR